MKKFGLLIVCTLLVLSSCNSSIDVYKQAFEREEMASLQSNWEAIMFSSYDRNSGNDDGFNGTYSKLRIENGNSVLAEVEGAGYVSRIGFTHSEHKKDGLLNRQNEHIRIFIDDKTTPAIDIPLEDVFSGKVIGFPEGLVGESLGGKYCYVPMPFSNYCRVEVEGDGVRFYQINVQKYTGEKEVIAYKPEKHEQLHQLLKIEGDEIFTCDGEMRIHGTGSEDYFNCAWYSVPGRLNNAGCFPLHGFPKFDMAEMGYASAYRWHLTDPVTFTDSKRVTIEKGPTNNIAANYQSIVFYYLSPKN